MEPLDAEEEREYRKKYGDEVTDKVQEYLRKKKFNRYDARVNAMRVVEAKKRVAKAKEPKMVDVVTTIQSEAAGVELPKRTIHGVTYFFNFENNYIYDLRTVDWIGEYNPLNDEIEYRPETTY